jgi:hypothetical protein
MLIREGHTGRQSLRVATTGHRLVLRGKTMKFKGLCHLLPLTLVGLGVASADPAQDLQWQGAWVVRDAEYPGSIQAWSVQGSNVVVYDPNTRWRETQQFTLQSGCSLVRTASLGRRSPVVTTNTFAFANDGLHVGPARAAGGVRRGPVLTACTGDRVYTIDAHTGACVAQPTPMSGSPATEADCSVSGSPPAVVLHRLERGQDVRLGFSGDALVSLELAGSVSERAPSLDAAVQRADSLAKQQ